MPDILNEAIPLATQTLDERLHSCQLLAHRYTALLESMQEKPHRHSQLGSLKLKEALFNVRQYEAFLCILQVGYHCVISWGLIADGISSSYVLAQDRNIRKIIQKEMKQNKIYSLDKEP